jgi:hypothetical protein
MRRATSVRRASVSLATGYSNSSEASGNVHLSPNVIARLLAVGMHQRVVERVDATSMSAPRQSFDAGTQGGPTPDGVGFIFGEASFCSHGAHD